ncbi:MAG TPA: hypothetical protein VN515_03605 [Terriglobales bacterium]|nr:hypothetical protein [Terriglobales bacterium]
MSLYDYVRTKAELVAAMDEHKPKAPGSDGRVAFRAGPAPINVFGYALREAAAAPAVDAGEVAKALSSGEFPQLAAAFGKGRVPAIPDRFKLGPEAILNAF